MDDDGPQPLLTSKPAKASKFNYVGDFLNTLKAFIGTNYLGLPYAFMNSGVVFGSVGVFFIATLTDHCCQLMIKCKYYAIENIIDDELAKRPLGAHELTALRQRLERTVGYGDLGAIVLGKWCKILIDLTVAFTQFLTIVCYYIFLGNAIFSLFPYEMASIAMNSSRPVPAKFGAESVDWGYINNPMEKLTNGIPVLNIPNINKWRYSENTSPSNTTEPGYLPDITMSGNLTTMTPANVSTTKAPTTPPPPMPTPRFYYKTVAPDMRYLCIIPLPFFIATSLLRKLRMLSPFTVIATIALFAGAMAVFVSMTIGFTLAEHFALYKLKTLPLFIGQLISAYEGIGCVLPIENSMEGNRHMFPTFLHGSIYIVFIILTSFGVCGYLRYGDTVPQIIILALTPSIFSRLIEITLIISVLCTYPLQCFPVILIIENYIFGPGKPCGPKRASLADPDEDLCEGIRAINEEDRQNVMESSVTSIESSHGGEVAVEVPPTVAGWKRNIVRVIITICALGCGVWMRNSYAFVSAFSGAIGCSLLAYILPCVIHIRLRRHITSTWIIFKDLVIIFLAIAASVMTLALIFNDMIHPHSPYPHHHSHKGHNHSGIL